MLRQFLLFFVAYSFNCITVHAQNNIIRMMSPEGKEINLVECESYYDFANGFAAVKTDSLWSYFDESGIPHFRNLQLITAESFADNGMALVQTSTGFGFINTTGKFIVQPIYSGAFGYDFNNLALVEQSNKWGVLNAQGKLIMPVEFDGIQSLGVAIAAFKENNVAFYTNTGKPLTGFDYTGYGRANYDVISIRSNAGWSFLDKNGNVSTPQTFEEIGNYAEGRIGFIRNSQMGYVNAKGMEVISPIYEAGDEFSDGLAAVKKDGLWGYIDTSGAVVIPMMYTAAYKFNNGIALVVKGDEWLSINKHNTIVTEPAADINNPGSTYIVEVKPGELVAFNYPDVNYRVEKIWHGSGLASSDGKLYDLSTNQLIGDHIVLDGQKIISGTFYKDNKTTTLLSEDGIPMQLIAATIANQLAADAAQVEAEKLTTVQTPSADTGDSLVELYTKLLEQLKQADDEFSHYLDLSTAFDLDAATEEERIANKQKKIQPYVDLVNDIVQTIDYLLANDPHMYEALEVELNDKKKEVLQQLKWIQ